MIYLKKEDIDGMSISELKRYKLQMSIIGLLYEHKSMMASDLSRLLNVSLPTIRSLMDFLISKHVVLSSDPDKNKMGRKPVIYSLNGSAYFICAVMVGHYRTKVVLYNCVNQMITSVADVETNIDDEQFSEKLHQTYQLLLTSSNMIDNQIVAIGVGMPGLINIVDGINHTIKDEAHRDVVRRLGDRFHKDVFIDFIFHWIGNNLTILQWILISLWIRTG